MVLILIPVDDGLLMIKRNQEPRAGLLAFPGGRVQGTERVTEAAYREALEETGLQLEPRTLRRIRVQAVGERHEAFVYISTRTFKRKDLPKHWKTEEVARLHILRKKDVRKRHRFGFPFDRFLARAYFAGVFTSC